MIIKTWYYYKMLDRQALARQSETASPYAVAFTKIYEAPENASIRDGARLDHLSKAHDAMHGTKLSLIPAAKAAAPMDEVQDYVDPNLYPAQAELDRLIVTRMKNDQNFHTNRVSRGNIWRRRTAR